MKTKFLLPVAFYFMSINHIQAGSKSVIYFEEKKESLSRWEILGGFGIRQSLDIDLKAPSMNFNGELISFEQNSSSLLANVGSPDIEGDRRYDDGFVNIGSEFNLTTNWGYNNAGQVRQSSQQWDSSQPWDSPGNQSLYMTASGGAGIAGYQHSTGTNEEAFPYIEARRWLDFDPNSYWQEKGLVVSWSWTPMNAWHNENLSLNLQSITDEFYLYGIQPPSAGYTGPALPPGPLLDNLPTDRNISDTSANLSGFTNTHADLDLQTFSLGGIVRRIQPSQTQLGRLLRSEGVDVQAGLVLNYAKLTMSSRTTVREQDEVVGSFEKKAERSKFLPGLYLAVGSIFDVGEEESWKLFSQVRFDLADSIETGNDGSSVKANLSGFSLNLGIAYQW